MDKKKVLDTINELPDKFDLDELIEKLIFIEKVEEGLKQSNLGKTVSHDQVKREVEKW